MLEIEATGKWRTKFKILAFVRGIQTALEIGWRGESWKDCDDERKIVKRGVYVRRFWQTEGNNSWTKDLAGRFNKK